MVRLATPQDVKGITEIYNDAIVNTTAVYTYQPYSLKDRLEWFDEKREEGYPVYIYEEEGRVVGFATYGTFRTNPAYKYTVEISVYVDKDCRNRGIGSALVEKIIEAANQNGIKTIVAGINASNEASIRLHEKMGFGYVGTVTNAGYKFGAWLDLSFYQLMLDGPQNPTED